MSAEAFPIVNDLLVDPLTVTDGQLTRSDAPGLGIELNMKVVEQLRMADRLTLPDGIYSDTIWGNDYFPSTVPGKRIIDLIYVHKENTMPRPKLLNDDQMRDFVVNGYVTLQTDFPTEFHDKIYQQAMTIFEKEGNPNNDIYPKIPQVADVFGHASVDGVLTSILGPGYVMHPHRHCHLTPPGKKPQDNHKDSYEADENVHHHRTRWAMAFYYPQDVPIELGPSTVRPASQYYNTQAQAERHDEVLLTGKAGTVTVVHYDLWHRASANIGQKSRFMMKFLFCRMQEPQKPSWNSGDATWHAPSNGSFTRRDQASLWQQMWKWHRGIAHGESSQPSEDLAIITEWIAALHDVSEAVRLDAAYALGGSGAAAVPAVLEALVTEAEAAGEAYLNAAHTNPSETYAGYALAAIGGPAVPALIDTLGAEQWWLRASAADILGDIGQPAGDAVPALRKALADESKWVRRNATEALGTIGSAAQAAVPALVEVLKHDEQAHIRHNAALALAKIGHSARDAAPALQAAQQDDDLYVRGNSAIALRRIAAA